MSKQAQAQQYARNVLHWADVLTDPSPFMARKRVQHCVRPEDILIETARAALATSYLLRTKGPK